MIGTISRIPVYKYNILRLWSHTDATAQQQRSPDTYCRSFPVAASLCDYDPLCIRNMNIKVFRPSLHFAAKKHKGFLSTCIFLQ